MSERKTSEAIEKRKPDLVVDGSRFDGVTARIENKDTKASLRLPADVSPRVIALVVALVSPPSMAYMARWQAPWWAYAAVLGTVLCSMLAGRVRDGPKKIEREQNSPEP